MIRTETAKPAAPPADTSEARWHSLTEALIFACQYGTTEYLRILDATGRPYNADNAIRRCSSLADAIATDYMHIQGRKLTRDGAEMDTATVRM